MNSQDVIERTRQWIARIVIGLNLCPFARRVFDAGLIRFVTTDTTDQFDLLDILANELRHLASAPRSEIETTLLIHPGVLGDFLAFNDFLGEADKLIRSLRLHGVIQIASFHPHYQFEGAAADAVENTTNRSPFPMLHLLREASITEVAEDPAVLLGIPERNIELLRKLGQEGIERLQGEPSGVSRRVKVRTDTPGG